MISPGAVAQQPPPTTPTPKPETIQTDNNPLNPAGDSLDELIKMRISDDAWAAMQGDLPCLEATEACIKQLQDNAINNSPDLREIDQRVQVIEQKIEEARRNNQSTIQLGIWEPLVSRYITFDGEKGFFEKVGDLLSAPLRGVNEILSFIGLPLFRNAMGGDAAAQTRQIAIADLQIKAVEIQKGRSEIARQLRETIVMEVLAFDQTRREFQIAQEIARRESNRIKLIEVAYRFGQGSTESYLSTLSALDTKKAQTFREWAKLRSQLARIKLLVLGDG